MDEIIKVLNPRVKAVIEKRFGLKSEAYQTLEAIGHNQGVTRERIRQIEVLGLKQLANKNVLESLAPAFDVIANHLKAYGGVRRKDYLLKELVNLFSLQDRNRENVINFVLALGKGRFSYFKETPLYNAAWALDALSYNNAINALEALKKKLDQENTPVSRNYLFKTLTSLNKDAGLRLANNDKILMSYLELSSKISQNPFGQWGLIHSPEISPKGVKDKAYLVFKKEKKPLHFSEVANLINKAVFSDKLAHPQTVHNELIKDPRFVLVGRGTYALSDWGYTPGTVNDVLISLLKNYKDGLIKEKIVKAIQSKRFVKENTILLNLQNKKVFKKSDDGRFFLV
ncbi:MAG: hypothetical protein HYW79_04115 [Parcubacteria group bacterium]|nr:hypothetical protein [Parcubacteria group bacterium]